MPERSKLDLPDRIGNLDVDAIVQRFERLKSGRTYWDQHWEEIAERIWPSANQFEERRTWQPGEKRTERVFDATAPIALEKFAAAMESLLTPRHQRWHRLRASDERLNENADVKQWFEELVRLLFSMRESPKASYYSQIHESYKSLGAFGTQVLYVDERADGGARYRHIHIGQVYAETDAHGQVDTIYRLFPLSAKAAEQRWGDQIPDAVKQSLEKDPYKKFDFLHYVAPRQNIESESLGPDSMPVRSVHIYPEDRTVIDDGGFHEMPYLFSRWTVNPVETYGRSPAMLVLPSIKMANEMQKTFIRTGHKVADPPLLARDEGVIGASTGRRVRLMPGGITYGGLDSQGKETLKPFLSGARLDITEGMLEKEREIINEAFLVPLFQALEERPPNMTATEVLERAKEKAQMLAPAIGRQQAELIGPQIAREVGILVRQGFVSPPPEALLEAEGEYEIEYVSPATLMQRHDEIIGIQRTLEVGAPFIAADPTVLDIFDTQEVFRISAEVTGTPTKVLRDKESLAEIKEQRQQAAAAEQAIAGARELAATAKDASAAGEATEPPPGGRT